MKDKNNIINKLNAPENRSERKFHFFYCNPWYYGFCTLILFFILWIGLGKTYQFILTSFNIPYQTTVPSGFTLSYIINVIIYIIACPIIAYYAAHSAILNLIDRKAAIILKTDTFILIAKETKEINYSNVQNIEISIDKSAGLEPEDSHWSPVDVTYTILATQQKYTFTSSLREGYKNSTFSSRYDLIKPNYSLDEAMSALIQKCPDAKIIKNQRK